MRREFVHIIVETGSKGEMKEARRQIVHTANEILSKDQVSERGGETVHNPVEIALKREVGHARNSARFDVVHITCRRKCEVSDRVGEVERMIELLAGEFKVSKRSRESVHSNVETRTTQMK